MNSQPIDEAALERVCIRQIQAVDRGSHSARSADSDDHHLLDATVVAIGWMYMDLERAVRELESAVALQDQQGKIPAVPGGDGAALPLLTSVARMIYHGARGRQRKLEGRLARLVPALDRFHAFLVGRGQRHLCLSYPADQRLLPSLEPRAEPLLEVGLNALLVQADSDLADIAIHTGYATRQIIARRTRVAQALSQRLWWDDEQIFATRQGMALLHPFTAESLLPLWAGAAPRSQARAMARRQLHAGRGFWGEVPLGSVAMEEPSYDPMRIDHGAVSPLTNWLLIRGLYRYGFERRARALNDTLLQLAAGHGMWQGYSAAGEGQGLGRQGSAVTAALILDLIKTPYTYERW